MNEEKVKIKRKSLGKINLAIQGIVTLLIFVFSVRLFYLQLKYPRIYKSSTPKHVEFGEGGIGYSGLYYLLGWIVKHFGSYQDVVIAVFEGILIVATLFALKAIVRKYSPVCDNFAFFISVICLFLSSMYIPIIQPFFYREGLITQPWMNITYIGMRLFAVFVIGAFISIIDNYQAEISVGDWASIAVPLLITTGIKPNFLIGFSWTLLLFLMIDVIKMRFSPHAVLQCIKMGTTVLPALVIMYIQSRVLYGSGEHGFGIALFDPPNFFEGGAVYTIVKILRSILLASIIIYYNRHGLNRFGVFIIVQYIISLIVVIFLHEKGSWARAGNFYWGLYCSAFFLMSYCWVKLIENTEELWEKEKALSAGGKVYFVVCWLLTAWHILSGMAYFCLISLGKGYNF